MKTADDPFRLVLWLTLFPGALAVLAFLMLVCDPEQSPRSCPEILLDAAWPAGTVQALPLGRRYLRYW
ncbi:hypothetical protein A4U53_011645 [Rhizobium ruizarguesonis]|uniref:Uncharacterized protein n=1 Tax=Rhizobium ruizarguesonis TaxID=2081791 RepID=A0ACD5EV30_9HYPH